MTDRTMFPDPDPDRGLRFLLPLLRERAGLSQKRFADRAGLSLPTAQRIEGDGESRTTSTLHRLFQFARLLGMSGAELAALIEGADRKASDGRGIDDKLRSVRSWLEGLEWSEVLTGRTRRPILEAIGGGCPPATPHGREPDNGGIGLVLTALREEKKLTRKELARDWGLSLSSVQRVEQGDASPRLNTLPRLSRLLGRPSWVELVALVEVLTLREASPAMESQTPAARRSARDRIRTRFAVLEDQVLHRLRERVQPQRPRGLFDFGDLGTKAPGTKLSEASAREAEAPETEWRRHVVEPATALLAMRLRQGYSMLVVRAPRRPMLTTGQKAAKAEADIVRLLGQELRNKLRATEPVLLILSSRHSHRPMASDDGLVATPPEQALEKLYGPGSTWAFVLAEGLAAVNAVGKASLLGMSRRLWGRGLIVVETDASAPTSPLESLKSGPVDWSITHREAIEKGLLAELRFVEVATCDRSEHGLEQLLRERPELRKGRCRVHVSKGDEQRRMARWLDSAQTPGRLMKLREEIEIVPRRAPTATKSRHLSHLILLSDESPKTLVAQVADALVAADPNGKLQVWELAGANAPKRREVLQQALGFPHVARKKGPRWTFECRVEPAVASLDGRPESPQSASLFEFKRPGDTAQVTALGPKFDLESIARRVDERSRDKRVAVSAGLYARDLAGLLKRAQLVPRSQTGMPRKIPRGEVLVLEKRGRSADRLPRVDAVFLLPPRPRSSWRRSGRAPGPRRRDLEPYVQAFHRSADGGDLEFIDCLDEVDDIFHRERRWRKQLDAWSNPPGSRGSGKRNWMFEVPEPSDDLVSDAVRELKGLSDARVAVFAGEWAGELAKALGKSARLVRRGSKPPLEWDESVLVFETRQPVSPAPPVDAAVVLPPDRYSAEFQSWPRRLDSLVNSLLTSPASNEELRLIDLCYPSDDLAQRRRLLEGLGGTPSPDASQTEPEIEPAEDASSAGRPGQLPS
jgi:transcriptional regulator with XRE-family HTH domain